VDAATLTEISQQPSHQLTDAERLSQHANIAQPQRAPRLAVTAVLTETQIAGADSAKGANPGWLSRQLTGIESVAGATGSGIAGKIVNSYDAGIGLALAADHLYEHPEQIAAAGRRVGASVTRVAGEAASATSGFAAHAIADPSEALADAGSILAAGATKTGDAVVAAGTATIHAGAQAAGWVAHHRLETTAMVGVAAVEALSVGTGTPILAFVAGAGGALAIHSVYSVADHLDEHSDQLSVLWNSVDHTAAEVAAAQHTVAADTGGAALGFAASLTGIGLARLVAGRAAAGAAQVEEASGGAGARTAGAATSGASQVSDLKAPPATPPRPHGDGGAKGQPASSGDDGTVDAHDQQVQAARAADHADLNDNSGRPLTDRNTERVAKEHPPLSAEELAAQRAATEKDLGSYKAAGGKSILDQLNSSNLSMTQRDRVLDVLAETRYSYLRPGANGQVAAEQLGSYRHTLGELKEGLDSAESNGLSARETQDALLAGMLSDSHKYGWSAAQGGNFFTHHLDGALAADAILSRRLGNGFDAKDLDAVRHAILEHQIGPPQFMAQSYANEIRAGMARAGVTPSAQDADRIASIQKLMSDPLHAAVEADSQGGYRVAFSTEERELLRRYVGQGTQNWHVPAPARSISGAADAAGSASGDALDPAKVSAVVRAADIFDNYFPEIGPDGQAIKGPFKIAALRGPSLNPPDLSLDDAISSVKNSMRQSEGLLTDADRARALLRATHEDTVYNQARTDTENWLRERGITPGANTPYWGKPLEAPPTGATPQQMQAWRKRPDVKLGEEIQAHFAQELHDMRLITP
jgi:hypothetical protein